MVVSLETLVGWLKNGRRRYVLLAAALSLFVTVAEAQYIPGNTYFGRSNYIEYAAGDLPFIMSAPHGGTLTPSEMPNRTNCASCSGWDFETATDSNTDDVADWVWIELGKLTGHLPHIIICHLDRDKIDCNRAVGEGAQSDPEAIISWNEFQNYINVASNNVITNFARGFYIDQHGQSHPEGRLELGYLLDKYDLTNTDAYMDSHSASFKNVSSIRTLANSVSNVTLFSQLLRGTNSFGELMMNEGYDATPSFSIPMPYTNPAPGSNFFDGGYNTVVHGSKSGGPLSAMQIEANYTGVRDGTNYVFYARAVARALDKFFAIHYGINLRTCAPTIWDVGSGSWSSTNNWALGILPVSSNCLVFAGSGGTATHNLAALATGNGVITSLSFGNAASGAYTLTGNAFTMNGGITNDNAFANVVNNNFTLPVNYPLAVNSGTLTAGGVVSGSGGFRKTGAGTLALTAINTYTGPTTNQLGTISLNATSTIGDGSGLLVWAGGDILLKNTRSAAPIANPILMTGNTTISGDGTLTNSLRILPFSANSVIASGGTLTVRHSGTNATATNNIFRVRFTGGFNFARPIVVGAGGDLSATLSQLESYNDLTAGDETFSSDISGSGQFRRDASNSATAGRTILSGANSYSGGTVVSAGTLLVNNGSGSGTGSGFVTVSNAGVLGGSGTIAGPVWCAGVISPGQSAGTLTLGGGLDLSNGGTNVWELASLSTTGEGINFDQIVMADGNLALGGSARLQINFIGGATPPDGGDPFWQAVRTWKIISLVGNATNNGATTFPGILNGSFAAGSFTNVADASGVWLKYLPTNAFARPLISPNVPGINAGSPTLQWSAVEGQTYQLQSKDDLTAPQWVVVGNVVAPGTTASLVDTNSPSAQRFYRVVIP